MSTIAFVLAAAAAGGAAVLWRLDARRQAPVAPVDKAPEVPDVEVEPEEEGGERQRPSLHLPGSLRRERRAWAEEKGFEFARADAWLDDEWSRGAASSGAVARDIVSGRAYGHEMVLMDLGGVNVMAMRRSASSDVVLDARRGGLAQESSEDLLEAFTLAGFTVLATDIGVAERLIDARVTTAFEVLPEVVTAVWMEADWVLAQTARGSHRQDWEAMLAPLAMLADAACALPPKATTAHTLLLDDLDPTRHMPGPPQPGFGVLAIARDGVDAGERPLVQRPEEPLDLPTRRQAVARGVVEPRAVGADEVEPIAEGGGRRDEQGRGPRMPRDLSGGSSLFDD
ncbi:hypothetical protein [Corynebacterium sp.]|uniref:hypothetical protein n=1 Tax=Corynebacterium sp. TaxID=1720 RepID=UPI0026DFFA2C|nr:hypothetical protein [Corynebacterium sp.]MDO5512222.1 hypothetical protein [Corynebacterium sp.]